MTKGSARGSGRTGRTGPTPAVLAGAVVVVAVLLGLLVTGIVLIATASDPEPSAVRTEERPATTAPEAPPVAGEIATLRIADPHFEGYDRDLFGDWSDADRDCQDTRAEVLAVESRVVVTYTTASACSVATGEWVDPWSDTVTTTASALDVDHTVPLANAWRSGAWAWTPEQRRAYANDMTDPGHLIAIPAGENRSKGDDGPEAWRPPAATSWCAYAQLWTSIKARWDLSATRAEWTALQEMAATC